MAASNTFYLKIISANRVFYSGRCRSLIVPEYDGQKEILAHHEDMVIAIDDGEMRFQPEGSENWEYAVVGMGFVEIVNNRDPFGGDSRKTGGDRRGKSQRSQGKS